MVVGGAVARWALEEGHERGLGADGYDALLVEPDALEEERYDRCMCRNIRTLYNFEPPADDEEVRAAALQYVCKISGFAKPSQANAVAFERAVDAVAAASARLLDELVTSAPPKDREVEMVKARARAAQRFAA